MDILQTIITILYYILVAYAAVFLVYNFIKNRSNWQQDALYVIVLIPFLLRLFRLK